MTDKRNHSIHITSNYQSGGITAHTVNINRSVQRALGSNVKERLLGNVLREHLVVVWAPHGDREAHEYANEIFQFMKSNGYNLFGDSAQSNVYFTPIYGVLVTPESDKTNIYVGYLSDAEKESALNSRLPD